MYIYLLFAIKVCKNICFHTFFRCIFQNNLDTYCMTSTWSMAHWSYPVFRWTGCHHRNWTPSFLASSGRSYAALFGRRYSSASCRARSFHSAPYIWKKIQLVIHTRGVSSMLIQMTTLIFKKFFMCRSKYEHLSRMNSLCLDHMAGFDLLYLLYTEVKHRCRIHYLIGCYR